MGEDVRQRIEGFIRDSLLLGDASQMPDASVSLLENGVIDSTGVLEVIEFLEGEFDIVVEADETVPENLDGIDRLVAYVDRKRG